MSNVLNKSDFYYGAFLTKVLDQGKKPALVSRGGGRCIYKVTTDKKELNVTDKNNLSKEKRALIKKLNKIIFFMYGSMIIGLVLGVYGQDISYFIDENIFNLSPVYYLTAITMLSIFLFLMPYIIVSKLNRNQEIEGKQLNIFFIINSLVGIMTSVWSLFILIMWWGLNRLHLIGQLS